MTVFACAGCGAALTTPLEQVALPAHAYQQYGYGLLGVLMEPGTYAVEPQPWGPPWQAWAEVGAAEAAARGVFAPVFSVSDGPRGAAVIAPGDLRGTVFIQDRLDGYCCGLDGRYGTGRNVACARCGLPVASRIDDCGHWQQAWLDPGAAHPVAGSDSPRRPLDWTELPKRWPGVPPIDEDGHWSPIWSAAVGTALAHLVAASGGAQVSVPDGLVADVFSRALDALLPPEPPARSLALSGPGLPATAADIALVPQHPQTGLPWAPAGRTRVVPLSWDVWLPLASARDRRLVARNGALLTEVLRDDPPMSQPAWRFTPDGRVFVDTLARLPEVRQPWLHEIYDRWKDRPHSLAY